MSRNILHTRPGEKDFHLFEELPALIYDKGSIRLQQKESTNNEFLHSCFVLTENNKPVARLALYFNPSLSYNEEIAACIGNYECIDDPAAAKQLLDHASEIARKNSYRYLIGPMNGSTWDNYRFSLHHDNSLFLSEPYHHLYYNDQLTLSGFAPVAKYLSLIDRKMSYGTEELKARERELAEQELTFRKISLDDYENELKKIYWFSMAAFRGNFLFTPISSEAFVSKYLPLKSLLDPSYIIIAEHAGNIAGYVFCFPDLYSNNKNLVLKTLVRDMSAQYKGLGNILTSKVTKLAKEKGFEAMIHAFMMETNFSVSLSNAYSGEPYSEYALYGKKI
jgi:hypothetical protein